MCSYVCICAVGTRWFLCERASVFIDTHPSVNFISLDSVYESLLALMFMTSKLVTCHEVV